MATYTQFEEDNSFITYHGTWETQTNSNYRGGTRIVNKVKTNIEDEYIEIFFKGTGFRIISSTYPTYSSSIAIIIDDTIIDEYSLTGVNANRAVVYTREGLEDTYHKIKMYRNTIGSYNTDFVFDGIDILGEGGLFDKTEYENNGITIAETPVKISDNTVESEEDVKAYAETIVNGERQLLIADKLKGLYVTDGNGGYTKILDENTTDHVNREVLDLLSTDGKDLFFNGKNVQSITTGEHQAYSGTFLNVVSGQICTVNIDSGSNLCEQIVQAWEFEEGLDDLITILKTFNNAEKDNFYYNSNEIEFTNSECKVKDKYILNSNLNSDGFYESEIINKDDFVEIVGLEVV